MLLQKNKLSLIVSAFGALSAPYALSQSDEPTIQEEVVVTGFRQAVAAALDVKRNSSNSMESIIAEDIGKMPDLNLGESLQRVPGVAITREGGEGRQVTVRGLGPQYTRVTLNGMEVPSSAGGTDASGGTNRGRAFDFNVFGSELFSKINIHKSAIASVEEGGLAATVELFSHRPLSNPGLTLTGSAQAGYNINSDQFNPRFSGLYSQTFMDDTFGVLAAVNYSSRKVRQDGFGTVRWISATDNRSGLPPTWGWASNATTINGTPNPSANYDSAYIDNINSAVARWNSLTPEQRLADPEYELDATNDNHVALANSSAEVNPLDFMSAPRLPRMDLFERDTERVGFAVGVEFRPVDRLKVGLQALGSRFEMDTTSLNYFAQIRNTHNNITPVSVDIDPSGRFITGGTFQNVAPRSESRVQYGTSDFLQIVADFEFDINDSMVLRGLIGNANATYEEDYFRNNFDVNTANFAANENLDFSYRLTNGGDLAEMSYGFDHTDYTNYVYFNSRLQRDEVERDYDTFKIDYQWDFDDQGSNLKAGFIYNDRNIVSNFSQSNISPDTPLTASNTTTVEAEYGDFGDGIGAPSGFPTDWVIADFDGLFNDLGRPQPAFQQTDGNTYDVTEQTTGIYAEVNWVYDKFLVNAGLRFVETEVTAGGFSLINDQPVFTEQSDSYSNTLPALNLTYNITEELRARLAWSENVTRPTPDSLTGAIEAAPRSGEVSTGNPGLGPEIAESTDAAIEWFFADESFLGLTLFQKDLTDAIVTQSFQGRLTPDQRRIVAQNTEYQSDPIDPGVVDLDGIWTITTDVNAGNVTINGWELGYQQVFESGFGLLANYTSVDSGDDVVLGLSDTTVNLGAFWENETFSARIVMNSRDDYVTRNPGRDGNATESTTGPTRFDVSSAWNVNDHFSITLEIINLTDEKERLYVDGPRGNLDLVREYNTTGTELFLGARYKF